MSSAPIIQHQASTSNYTVPIMWYKGGVSQGGYDPQIGQHNTGGDGTGSICILPYSTSADPWEGTVGLFVQKGLAKLDNNTLIHSGNISSQSVNYATSAGSVAWGNVSGKPASATRWPTWDEVTSKPTFSIGDGYVTINGTTRYNVRQYTISNGSNANNFKTTGHYITGYNHGVSNLPNTSAMEWGLTSIATRLVNTDDDYGWQVAWPSYTNPGRIYTRQIQGGSWTGWKALAWTSDIPSTISWENVTAGTNSNGAFTITGGSERANLNLITAVNKPNDLYFGSAGNLHWSWSSRENSDPWIGLYNAAPGTASGTWAIQISKENNNATFGGAVYSNSDRHLKKNISSIPASSLECLFDISDKLLKKFTWKQTGKDSYGFIAQELEQYIPEAVSENKQNVKTVSYDIAYAKVIASLIHKIKALESKVDDLSKLVEK